MKTRKNPQEAYHEVLSKLGRNLLLVQRTQRLTKRLATLGGLPDLGLGERFSPAELFAERNQLLRDWLPSIDRTSVRSCARVGRLLDAQQRRVHGEIDRLQLELRQVCSGMVALA